APSTLAEELDLLRRAQGALRANEIDTALARLDEHERRFPDGQLQAEREAARVVALCRGARPEARAQASRFLRERASSPLAARVRAACDLEPAP
ncbi:MAG: hypothetical protein K8H88_11325, partial [Sandaracinaceae bacterium]|nr:hypothetical protein [Sandaracinaceae bacterium]